jgi:hypothetical protein
MMCLIVLRGVRGLGRGTGGGVGGVGKGVGGYARLL